MAEPGSAYAAELAAAADKAGTDESLVTGTGTLQGRRVAVVVGEFGFLAGSIGRAAAERLVLAVERATREGLPLFAAPTSGGTRMQEGTRAFVGMVKISAAVAAHKEAGLPYIVYLRHPTTGGVFASWGSLGHVTVAEPGALVGFLGPRVYEALYDAPFPPGVQTSENLYEHGLLDAVLPIEALAEVAARALNVLMAPREGLPVGPRAAPREPAGPARLGVDHPLPAARAAGRAGPAQARRLRRRAAARHRPGRAGPRAADRPRPLRRRARAWCSARTAGTRRWTTRSARPACARPGAACGSPTSSSCPWSASSTPPGPRCPRRPRRAAWPARSPAASPSW